MLARRAFMSRSRLVERPRVEGSRMWLIAELDKYTSVIVRRRDKRCVTCGSAQGLRAGKDPRAGVRSTAGAMSGRRNERAAGHVQARPG